MPKRPIIRLGPTLLVLSILPLVMVLAVGAGFFVLDLRMMSLEVARQRATTRIEKVGALSQLMSMAESIELRLIRYRDTVDEQELAGLSETGLRAADDLVAAESDEPESRLAVELKRNLSIYLGQLRRLQTDIHVTGAHQDAGLEGRTRAAAHEVEALLAANLQDGSAADKSGARELMVTLLMLRRHEKDFIMRGDAAYIGKFGNQVNRFRQLLQLASLPVEQVTALKTGLAAYRDNFSRYADRMLALRSNSADLSKLRHDLLWQLGELQSWAVQSGDAAVRLERGNVKVFRVFLACMIGGGLGLTMIAAFLLLRDIRRPLLGITRATSSLAAGRLETPVPHQDRQDEIGALARFVADFRRTAMELRDMRERALAAQDAAEAMSQRKSIFLANTSHELRSPLNAIIGFSEVLGKGYAGQMTAKQREYIADIESAGRHLLKIIGDLLDLSKAENNRIELAEEVLDISSLCEECLGLVEHQGKARGLSFAAMMPVGGLRFRADHLRLKQVLLNLLSNAVKFARPAGQVVIGVDVPLEGDFRLYVRDDGVGMTQTQIAKALELFGQADNHFIRTREGTGLGLPLAAKLMELHGGRLEVISAPGAGTTVNCFLPRSRLVTVGEERRDDAGL